MIKRKHNYIDRTGEIHITNEGYEVKIIYYNGRREVVAIFKNGHKIKTTYGNIKNGSVKNPYHVFLCNVGYYGVGNHKAKINGKNTKAYDVWAHIIRRCYSKQVQEKQPTYIGCSVDESWYNFQVFAEWFYKNYKEGFHLDKDIKIKGNKIYSPETCEFIPREINNLFTKCGKNRGLYPIGVSLHKPTGKYMVSMNKNAKVFNLGLYAAPIEAFNVYKTAKESWIKDIAQTWKPFISINVYQALMNYKVEITD